MPPDPITHYLQTIGTKGGRASTKAQNAARCRNIAVANAKKKKARKLALRNRR